MSAVEAAVASPCNSVCRIEERSGWCLGCYRTLDEIAAWSAMPEAQKLAVHKVLKARRRTGHLESTACKDDP